MASKNEFSLIVINRAPLFAVLMANRIPPFAPYWMYGRASQASPVATHIAFCESCRRTVSLVAFILVIGLLTSRQCCLQEAFQSRAVTGRLDPPPPPPRGGPSNKRLQPTPR
jgi:hypothetical protein